MSVKFFEDDILFYEVIDEEILRYGGKIYRPGMVLWLKHPFPAELLPEIQEKEMRCINLDGVEFIVKQIYSGSHIDNKIEYGNIFHKVVILPERKHFLSKGGKLLI